MSIRRCFGIVILAGGLGLAVVPTGARAAEPLPPLVTTLETVADTAADVLTAAPFDPDTQKEPPPPVPGDNPRADVTRASLEWAPGWIRMKVQVKQPTDPLKDPAWSDRSDAEWALDTNNDGRPDFSVEYATHDGELYGAVFDMSKPEDEALCDADSASFSAEEGYVLVVDPKCIGNPTVLGYSVAVFFVTNPRDENAPMASDRVPDQGFKAVAAPVQPGEAPARTPASAGTPTAPAQAPPASLSAAPGATSSAPRGPASAPGGAVSSPAGPNGAPVAPAPTGEAGPSGPLARTGSASSQQALLGLGLLLLGAGVVVMTRPTSPMATARS